MIQLTLQDQILQHLYKPQGPSLLQTLKAHNFVIFDFIFVMQLSLDPINPRRPFSISYSNSALMSFPF